MNRLGRVLIRSGSAFRAACVQKTPVPKNSTIHLNVLRTLFTQTKYRNDAVSKEEPFKDPKEVTDRIIEVIKNFEKVNKDKVTPQARFKEDLDLDSLDAVEVVLAIEEEFGIEIPDSEADKIFSVADAVEYVSTHPMAL